MGNNGTGRLVYFAVFPQTAEVYDDTDFRRLYNTVRAELKKRVHSTMYYEFLTAVIAYGTVYNTDSGRFRTKHYTIRPICRVTISGIAGIIGMNEVEKLGVQS